MTSNTANDRYLTYTEKLSLSTATFSTLYMLPLVAQAGVVSITTPLSITIDAARDSNYQPVDWDVDGNSVADFRLEAFRSIFYTGTVTSTFGGFGSSRPYGKLQLNSSGLAGQGMIQNSGSAADAIQDLPAGTTVGPTLGAGLQWGAAVNRTLMISSDYSGFATGNLYGPGHLVGFRFQGDAGQTLYGWAEISLDELALTMTIDQWAYDNSGSSIRVGQVSSVPLPPAFLSMLSGLALGAGGVLRGRKQRKAAQDRGA